MDLVFLSTQGWDEMGGAGRPTHYLAREALARGHRVLFVQVVASWNKASGENFKLVSFEVLGYDENALRRAWFGLDPRADVTGALTRALDAFEARDSERVVVYADPFMPFLEWFTMFRERGYKIVYDALDDFEAFPEIGLYFANREAERFLVAQADLVLAVSTTLVEKLSAWGPRAPVRLLRQGFDPAIFQGARAERAPHSSVTLGFWGHVNAFNVDVALMEFLARARAQWTIQLIGPVDHDPALPRVQEALRALPNVQLVGRVAHAELPRYLERFDVALVPFPANAFNRARDPLKVYEYLSGYTPVVAAHTPQLRGMPYVAVAETPPEFLEQVERALAIPVERERVDAYLAGCTWAKRFAQFVEMTEKTVALPRPAAPDIRGWYGDAALAQNVQEYIARTEQLLMERTDYVRALESDAQAKQAHIKRLQQFNPIWSLKSLFDT